MQLLAADRGAKAAERERLQRVLAQFTAGEIEQKGGGQRAVDDQAAVAFLAFRLGQVVVNPVAVESQRGVAQQQRFDGGNHAHRVPC